MRSRPVRGCSSTCHATRSSIRRPLHTCSRRSRRQGCTFSLDDFGSGVSSFAYLKALSADYLKIDGMFVGNISQDRVDYAMVRSIKDIGHVMGKKVIAESVETHAVLAKLREIGIDYAQGFAVGHPQPLEELAQVTVSDLLAG